MKFKKSATIILKSAIFLIPIQLFFLSLVLQRVSVNIYYQENYKTDYGIALCLATLFVFGLYIFFGFFIDLIYQKTKKYIIFFGSFLILLTIGFYYISFAKFNYPFSLLKMLNDYFSVGRTFFGFALLLAGFVFLLAMDFMGFLVGSLLGDCFIRKTILKK